MSILNGFIYYGTANVYTHNNIICRMREYNKTSKQNAFLAEATNEFNYFRI